MKYIVTSDIHLGHKKTPTQHIIQSFKTHILNDHNRDIDVLFIAGDLFDHLLYLNTKEAQQCVAFFHYLLDYCCMHEITLIILEGTPFHDWYQSNMVPKINEVRERKATVFYHRTLDIQYLPQFQKHILYIPDEWCKSQEDLEQQINAKLQEHGITKVDIAILHGQFRYQLQGRPSSVFCYDEAYFLSLVRERIHIGHYHTYSEFDRIIANGSLERLAHGEEQPKGYLKVCGPTASFIENPDAMSYVTIHITPKHTITQLDRQVKSLRKNSHVRLHVAQDHPFNVIFAELKVRYVDYHLTKKLHKDASESDCVAYITHDEAVDFSDHAFLETNIYDALMSNVHAKHTFNPQEQQLLEHYAQPLRAPLLGDES